MPSSKVIPSRSNKEARRRANRKLESVFRSMDYEERQRKDKPSKAKGKRAEFLEYYRIKGFDEAKRQINSGFKKEVYNDEILKKWIEEENKNKEEDSDAR